MRLVSEDPQLGTIGAITLNAAVVSFNGNRVVHFNHSSWRDDRNDPRTVQR
jgi:hypothetical protein